MLLLIASRDAAVGGTYSIRPGTSYGDEIGFRYSSWTDPGGILPWGLDARMIDMMRNHK